MQLNALFLFLGELGGGEIMVIMVAVLLLFGANKIPGIARSLGSGIREFKDATNGIKNEIERSVNEDPKPIKRDSLKENPNPGLDKPAEQETKSL